jgi:hypothetical protein
MGRGHVIFDRGESDYLDGGSHDLNIASNGGLTIVAVVLFKGSVRDWERIIDFGNGPFADNIVLCRGESTNLLRLDLYNGATRVLRVDAASVPITQNEWLTIITRYDASTLAGEIRINGALAGSATASAAVTDKTFSGTYVGKSHWSGDAYVDANMAGLAVIDKHLDLDTAAAIADSMRTDPMVGGCDKHAAGCQGSEPQTLTQTWGAGVVWQFKYKIEHLEGSNEIGTQNTALTQDVQAPPCCLPGTFADPDSPHGNLPQQAEPPLSARLLHSDLCVMC